MQVPLVYAGSADDQEWKQQSRISSKDGWEHQTDQGCTVCRWRKGQWGYHARLECKLVYRWFSICIRWSRLFFFIVVSCCNCRSCTSSVMLHSLLSPTKALHVTWILPKNLSCPPNSSSYKTRQCTLGRSFLNWCIENTWTTQKYKSYDDQLINRNACLRLKLTVTWNVLTAVFSSKFCQQDFKNDKEYLSTEMRQLLLTGKVTKINPSWRCSVWVAVRFSCVRIVTVWAENGWTL